MTTATAESIAAQLLAKRDVAKAAAKAAKATGRHAVAERFEQRRDVYEEIIDLIVCEHGEAPAPVALDVERDATPAEIALEPDGVLEHLASGDLAATEVTRRLARAELDYRRRP
jgi:hypothetical protein